MLTARVFWQVIIMCIASVFGTITLIGFTKSDCVEMVSASLMFLSYF